MTKTSGFYRGIPVGFIALVFLLSDYSTVMAQGVLEEVVVTARKRTESLLDVPISITTMSSEHIERLSAISLKDLRHAVPSLHYQDRSALQTEFTIRGVGGDARNVGIESGVGLYVDGVYAGRTAAYNIDLADVEQIEILRGPQGTLFGKNTTGGALNITTRKPTDEFEANAAFSYGNYDAIRFKGSLGGGLSENLYGKITASTWDRDGYLHNLFDNTDLQSEERRSGRAQLRFAPSDKLEVNLSADVTFDEQKTILNQLGSNASFGAGFFNSDRFLVNTDQRNSTERDLYGISLHVDYMLDSGHTITSITSYRDLEITVHSDIDQTPNDVFRSGPFTDDGEQFTQELRLVSPGGEFLDYVLGVYYYEQDAEALRRIYAGGNPIFFTDGPVDTTAIAGFANVNLNLTEQVTITGGIRVTDEEKEGSYTQSSPVPFFNKAFPDLDTSSTEVSWTASANYKVSEDFATYVTASRGFKSGGFNVDPLATPAPLTADEITFDPEFVTTYEIGFKSELWNNRARISGAVFYTDYKDRQVPQFEAVGGIPTVITRNAGKAEITGAELEFSFVPSEYLLLFGAVSYLDGEYEEFQGATAAGGDFSGNTTEKTPEWNLSLGAELRTAVGAGEFILSPQYSYIGETYLQPDNGAFHVENGYSVLNLRAGYELNDGKYGIYFWGKNLTDEHYKEFARQFSGSDQVLWGEPRTYGVEIKASYN